MDAKTLREKFEQDLENLQITCPHKQVSEWMEYHFAPGHFGGMVKVCLCCDKIIENMEPNHNIQNNATKATSLNFDDGPRYC